MKPAKLTEYQYEITRRLAWGATQKEVALHFGVSRHTIDNILRNIFQKTGVTKVNELGAWFFCTEFGISFDLSPLAKKRIAQVCLCLMFFVGSPGFNTPVRRIRIARTTTCVCRIENFITL